MTRLFGGHLAPLVVGLVLATIGATVADPLQDGSLAYQRKDYEAALNIWRPIAEQGNPEAQRWLGRLYDSGLGVPKDQAKAEFGRRGVTKDKTKAIYWYEKAAERGNIQAQYFLAEKYERGDGVPKDTDKAVFWLRKAAAHDKGDFMQNLAAKALVLLEKEGAPQ